MEKKVVDFDKFKEKKAKNEVKEAKIDKEVLDIMSDEQIVASITDNKGMARFTLNCFCELLSQFNAMNAKLDELSNAICIASADKMTKFFKEVEKNTQDEADRIELQKKIGESHKKSKKGVKTSKKSIK